MKQTLLIPLDEKPFSRKILSRICDLFPAQSNQLRLLHVYATDLPMNTPPPRYSYGQASAMAVPHKFDKEGMDAETHTRYEQLTQDAEDLRKLGYAVTVELRTGDPVTEIVAASQTVSLIAMATHARTAIGQLLLGSVAQAVMVQVDIPVLLLPANE